MCVRTLVILLAATLVASACDRKPGNSQYVEKIRALTTSAPPWAGNDASPYERPSPRDSGMPAVTAAKSSERASRASATGTRPQPDRTVDLEPFLTTRRI